MADKIRRIRCGTPKCSGLIGANVSTIPKSEDGNWQFHCVVCGFWSLFSEAGMMRATSRDQFDLTRLSANLRAQLSFTRNPDGGV
jgi:hypothetical protein